VVYELQRSVYAVGVPPCAEPARHARRAACTRRPAALMKSFLPKYGQIHTQRQLMTAIRLSARRCSVRPGLATGRCRAQSPGPVASAASAIPEPIGIGLLTLGTAGLLARPPQSPAVPQRPYRALTAQIQSHKPANASFSIAPAIP